MESMPQEKGGSTKAYENLNIILTEVGNKSGKNTSGGRNDTYDPETHYE